MMEAAQGKGHFFSNNEFRLGGVFLDVADFLIEAWADIELRVYKGIRN